MILYPNSSGPPRRGVILLVVVLMLALFLVVGLSFVYYAESASTGSRIYMEAQAPDAADIPPETLMAFWLGQFIYGTSDDVNGALSAIRGHDLARLMYGWNYTGSTNNPLMADATKTNIIASETFLPNQIAALAQTPPYTQGNTTPYNGLGPLRTLTAPKDNNGNPVNEYDLVNYTWFASESLQPPAYMRAATDPTTMVRVRDPEHPAATPNLLRPDPTQPYIDPTNPPKWSAPFAGGFNIPYTFADRSSMFVAAVEANINHHNPSLPPQPALLMPSFVRGKATLPFSVPANPKALQLDPNTQGGNWFWTATPNQQPPAGSPPYSSAWKYMTLRPRPGDQLSSILGETTFPPNRPYFPPPADAGGDVKNLPGVPFFIRDQNGNISRHPQTLNVTAAVAQNDSFWMDLNYPVQITRNGKKYKPLFAFLVLDLDGRLNLNVHGNINGQMIVSNQGQQQVVPFQHVSDQAIGRHEVNLSTVLPSLNIDQNKLNTTVAEWTWLFIGNQSAQGLASASFTATARYGPALTNPVQQVPGLYDPTVGASNKNQYSDPYATDVQRSLVFPFDFDALDANNNRQVTAHVTLPFQSYATYPQFSVTGHDNFTYDATKPPNPPLNPRLNHPLLNQKLRSINVTTFVNNNVTTQIQSINEDQPFGDDNLFNVLAGDYRKSFLYGLVPNNLDGVNVPVPSLGAVVSNSGFGSKVRQLISTRSYDLDSPGAPPWIVNPTPAGQNDPLWPTRYECAQPTAPSNIFPYPSGAQPFVTPTPAQIPNPATPFGDYKPGDGRANLLSRVDLARKLTAFVDPASGVFNYKDPNTGKPVAPPTKYPNTNVFITQPFNPAILYQFPLSTNPQLRYYYAMYERQQFAKDIFDRLVKATGAVPPPSTTPPPPGTLAVANGSTPQQYAATRWLAQLAVNIVDYVDEDDIITPFQWNVLPDASLETGRQDGQMPQSAGWVFGTEAPSLLVNEVLCELQNSPADRPEITPGSQAPQKGATQPYQFNFWLELYNPLGADPALVANPKTPTPTARQDPNRGQDPNNPGGFRDRLSVPLEATSPGGMTYPVYEVVITADSQLAAGSPSQRIDALMWPQENTDGWMTPGDQRSYVKIQLTAFNGTPTPANTDYKFVYPSTGAFDIGDNQGQTNQPRTIPANQGFYVIGPNAQQHNFAPDVNPPSGPHRPFKPTLAVGEPQLTPSQSAQMPWGTDVQQNSVIQNGLTYNAGAAATADTSAFVNTKHAVVLRRLACPYLEPNPINRNTPPAPGQPWQPLDPSKPFNPYVTVDYMNNIPVNDGVQYVIKANNAPPINTRQTPSANRLSVGRRQPYAAALIAKAPRNQNPTEPGHTFFRHNDTTATLTPSETLDAPFDWYVHLDRPPSNILDILQVSGVRPSLMTQQFVRGQFAAAQTYMGRPLSETKFQHFAPWSDQGARIYRALEYFTVGDRSPYPGTLGRVAGKINVNAIFDREMTDAMIDPRAKQNLQANPPVLNPNFFHETAATPTAAATGAATDVWQGDVGVISAPNSLAQMLTDPKNMSIRNRKQQMLGLDGVAPPQNAVFPPDRPFWSFGAPAVSILKTTNPPFPGDPQYQAPDSAGQPADLAGIAGTILPYNDPSSPPSNPPSPIPLNPLGTFTPVKTAQTAGGTPDYAHSIDYTTNAPQNVTPQMTPTLPPYILDELLAKVSGHVTPRGNNFAVFVTVGFFEVIDDTTMPVKLGAELTTGGGKTLRHQMFAVVDRTNLALDAGTALNPFNLDPTGRLRQAPTPPVFMTVAGAIPAGSGAPAQQNQPATPVTVAVNGGLSPPTDYDGTTPVSFKPYPVPANQTPPVQIFPNNSATPGTYWKPDPTTGLAVCQWMFLDTGPTQEPVQVMKDPTGNQLLLLFPNGAQFGHPPGAVLCNYQPGNPGPQGPIDYTSPQYRAVVPYTYIIQ